ncbi:hypothetical protein TI04_08195 [Achromatium sp. WMS2]|nr:hypothetical protein TI04_08195 [Achromatium sp. WMS2]
MGAMRHLNLVTVIFGNYLPHPLPLSIDGEGDRKTSPLILSINPTYVIPAWIAGIQKPRMGLTAVSLLTLSDQGSGQNDVVGSYYICSHAGAWKRLNVLQYP